MVAGTLVRGGGSISAGSGPRTRSTTIGTSRTELSPYKLLYVYSITDRFVKRPAISSQALKRVVMNRYQAVKTHAIGRI